MKNILIICHDNLLYGASKSLLDWMADIQVKNQKLYKFYIFIPSKNGELIKEFQKKGFEVITFKYFLPIRKFHSIKLRDKIKNFIRIILALIVNPFTARFLIKFCKEKKIDLVHSNSFVIPLGANVAKKLNIPHIWHIREFMEEDHRMTYALSHNKISNYTRYSHAIFISEAIANKFKNKYDFISSEVIYNKVYYDIHYTKERVFMEDNVCNIIVVGKITKSKGQMHAIKAIEKLRNTNYKINLYFCGEGPEESYLKSYVKHHNLNNIYFLGFQKELLEIRKKMDISLMLSQFEAFGRVTVEAMYYENVVIALKKAGTIEIIRDESLGYLCDNYEELPNIIVKVIETQNTANLLSTAKRFAVEKFSHNIDNKIFSVYQNLFDREE